MEPAFRSLRLPQVMFTAAAGTLFFFLLLAFFFFAGPSPSAGMSEKIHLLEAEKEAVKLQVEEMTAAQANRQATIRSKQADLLVLQGAVARIEILAVEQLIGEEEERLAAVAAKRQESVDTAVRAAVTAEQTGEAVKGYLEQCRAVSSRTAGKQGGKAGDGGSIAVGDLATAMGRMVERVALVQAMAGRRVQLLASLLAVTPTSTNTSSTSISSALNSSSNSNSSSSSNSSRSSRRRLAGKGEEAKQAAHAPVSPGGNNVIGEPRADAVAPTAAASTSEQANAPAPASIGDQGKGASGGSPAAAGGKINEGAPTAVAAAPAAAPGVAPGSKDGEDKGKTSKGKSKDKDKGKDKGKDKNKDKNKGIKDKGKDKGKSKDKGKGKDKDKDKNKAKKEKEDGAKEVDGDAKMVGLPPDLVDPAKRTQAACEAAEKASDRVKEFLDRWAGKPVRAGAGAGVAVDSKMAEACAVSGCTASREEMAQYLEYSVGAVCPDDWFFVQSLVFDKKCSCLPRRRCFAPDFPGFKEPLPLPGSLWDERALEDANVKWDGHHCSNYSCLQGSTDYVPDCKDCFTWAVEKQRWGGGTHSTLSLDALVSLMNDTLRIGLDLGGGSGSFAAKMSAHNITIVTTAKNAEMRGNDSSGVPYLETIALRGLLPLHLPYAARLPFPDNSMDIIHVGSSINGIPYSDFEEMMYDWDRVLRPGGIFWFNEFFHKVRFMPKYMDILDTFKYTFLHRGVSPEIDPTGLQVYMSFVLMKPREREIVVPAFEVPDTEIPPNFG